MAKYRTLSKIKTVPTTDLFCCFPLCLALYSTLEKKNSDTYAHKFKVCVPKGGMILSLCNGCVKSLRKPCLTSLGHAKGAGGRGQERAGHMIDSPNKTTWKGDPSLKEELGGLTERQQLYLHSPPYRLLYTAEPSTGPGT